MHASASAGFSVTVLAGLDFLFELTAAGPIVGRLISLGVPEQTPSRVPFAPRWPSEGGVWCHNTRAHTPDPERP